MNPVSSAIFFTRSRTSVDKRNDTGFDFDVDLGMDQLNFTVIYTTQH
jgi:hypothetical protein